MMPLFLSLLLGLVEMGSALSASQTLHGALREGGRLASMDYRQVLGSDVDANTKVVQDIRNMLTAGGIPGNEVTIRIVHAGAPLDGQTFDLNNTGNYLKLFRIEATVPYSAISSFPNKLMEGKELSAQLTLRKGSVSLVTN